MPLVLPFIFLCGACWRVSGGERYHNVGDPQPFLERSPARVDVELQRPRQDSFQKELPYCARKGRYGCIALDAGFDTGGSFLAPSVFSWDFMTL